MYSISVESVTFLNTSVTIFYPTLHSQILVWYKLSKLSILFLKKYKHTLHKQATPDDDR